MKTRVISGIVVALILIGAAFLMFTPVFDILFATLAALSCYEITKVAGVRSKPLRIVAIVFSAALVAGLLYISNFPLSLVCMIYVIGLILLTVCSYDDISFADLAITIYASFVVPIGYATIPLIADSYKMYSFVDRKETVLLVWCAVATALLTDVFAYFVGSKFGKHKMAPELSPKKSWEGAIGGAVCATLFQLLALLVFRLIAKETFFLPIWAYLLMNLVVSVVSMFGDLIASLIKRNYNVKDFSHLIPGHGGIMDRFDSVLLAAPTLYVFLTIYGLAVA